MDYLYQNGITVALELGPRKVLGQLMKERYPSISTFSINTSSSLKEADKWLSKQQTTRKFTLERLEEGFAAALIARNRNGDYKQHMEGVVYLVSRSEIGSINFKIIKMTPLIMRLIQRC